MTLSIHIHSASLFNILQTRISLSHLLVIYQIGYYILNVCSKQPWKGFPLCQLITCFPYPSGGVGTNFSCPSLTIYVAFFIRSISAVIFSISTFTKIPLHGKMRLYKPGVILAFFNFQSRKNRKYYHYFIIDKYRRMLIIFFLRLGFVW